MNIFETKYIGITLIAFAFIIPSIIHIRKNGLRNFLEMIADAVNDSERAILDLLSAFVPYAVPIIPAYLTYFHTRDLMDFPSWVAFTAAFVVETLGMASVSTAIKFYRNNQKYTSTDNKAPFSLALTVYIFYLVIVMSVNVILEIYTGTRNGWIITTIGLFTLLSVPSGVLISIRAQYREILDERVMRYGKKPKTLLVEEKQKNTPRPRRASEYKDQMITMLDSAYESGTILELTEITAKLKLDHENSKGYVSTVRTAWMKERGIEKPVRKNPLSF